MENSTEIENDTKNLISTALKADWSKFHQLLQELPAGYQLPSCLKLLNTVDNLLNQESDIAESTAIERYLVGGIQDNQTQAAYAFNTELLGQMNGYASFKKILRSDPKGFAKLMRVIPKVGTVDGWHYLQFVDTYQQWFNDNGYKQCVLFPITRLLSMKRPDHFIPLNEETSPLLCSSLGIKPLKKQDFKRYWDDVIERIHKTEWFKMFQPMDPSQIPFHRSRVALLERLAVVPITSVQLEELESEQQPSISNNEIAEPIEQPNDPTLVQNSQPIENTANRSSATSENKNPFIRDEIPTVTTRQVKQPKKMTINKLQTAKGNLNAATKLMSQYYFANKEKFVKVNIKKHRTNIIDRIVEGESVEEIFDGFL